MQYVRTPAGATQADLAHVATEIHQVCLRQSPFAIMTGHVTNSAVSHHDFVEKLVIMCREAARAYMSIHEF